MSAREAGTGAGQAATDWGIWVNEVGVFASGHGADKWLDFQARDRQNRLTALWLGPCGGEWHVMCGTRDDARETLSLFLEVGFHKTHVRVARLPACQAKTEHRKLAGTR